MSGRGDPRDSVRQSAARRPATAEVAPKMYSGAEALRDACKKLDYLEIFPQISDQVESLIEDLAREVDCDPGS